MDDRRNWDFNSHLGVCPLNPLEINRETKMIPLWNMEEGRTIYGDMQIPPLYLITEQCLPGTGGEVKACSTSC